MLRALLGLVLPVLLVVSCATPAYVEKDEQADFSRYRSFAWIDNSNKEGKNHQNEFLKKQRSGSSERPTGKRRLEGRSQEPGYSPQL